MAKTLSFVRITAPTDFMGMESYLARAGIWDFLIIKDLGKFTASYRLHNPKGTVSASSTIMGPFDEFYDAVQAAQEKHAELLMLS